MRLHTRPLVAAGSCLFMLVMGIRPIAAQNQSESQFISSTTSVIQAEQSALTGQPKPPIIFAAAVLFAYGTSINEAPIQALYVFGANPAATNA